MTSSIGNDGVDNGFNPEDLAEMDGIMDSMVHDAESGFCIEFAISTLHAKELIELYWAARGGDRNAQAKCWSEYAKIMRAVIEAHETP